MQHEIHPRQNSGTGVALAILHVETIFEDLRHRCDCRELFAASVMGRAVVSIQKPGLRGYDRSGADRNEFMAGSNDFSQPLYDRRPMSGVRLWPACTGATGAHHHIVDIAGNNNHCPIRQDWRKRLYGAHGDADRRPYGGGGPDVAHIEVHVCLLDVGAAQNLHRPRYIEHRETRWEYYVHFYSSHL